MSAERFRRLMAPDEMMAEWTRLSSHWEITDHYWYPLDDCTRPNLAAFQADVFAEAMPAERLQAMLTRRGILRMMEFQEFGPAFELEVALLEPNYDARGERYWSSSDMEWIVYASHENSITVGGWLLDDVKAVWPAWGEHLWLPFAA